MTDSIIDELHTKLLLIAKIDKNDVEKWLKQHRSSAEPNPTHTKDIDTKCQAWILSNEGRFDNAMTMCDEASEIVGDILANLGHPYDRVTKDGDSLSSKVTDALGKSTLILHVLLWGVTFNNSTYELAKLQAEINNHVLKAVGCSSVEDLPESSKNTNPVHSSPNTVPVVTPVSLAPATSNEKSRKIPTTNEAIQSPVASPLSAPPTIPHALSPDAEPSADQYRVDQNAETEFESSGTLPLELEVIADKLPPTISAQPQKKDGDTRRQRRISKKLPVVPLSGDSGPSKGKGTGEDTAGKKKKQRSNNKPSSDESDKELTSEKGNAAEEKKKHSGSLAPSKSASGTTTSTSKSSKSKKQDTATQKRKKGAGSDLDDSGSEQPANKKTKRPAPKPVPSSSESSSSEAEQKETRTHKKKTSSTSKKNSGTNATLAPKKKGADKTEDTSTSEDLTKKSSKSRKKDSGDEEDSDSNEPTNDKPTKKAASHKKSTKPSSKSSKKTDEPEGDAAASSTKAKKSRKNNVSKEIGYMCSKNGDPLPTGVQSFIYDLPSAETLLKEDYITATYDTVNNIINVKPKEFVSQIRAKYVDDRYVQRAREDKSEMGDTNKRVIAASQDFHEALKTYKQAKEDEEDDKAINQHKLNVQYLGKKFEELKRQKIMDRNVTREEQIHKTVAQHAILKCIAGHSLPADVPVDYDTSGLPEHQCFSYYVRDETTGDVMRKREYQKKNKLASTLEEDRAEMRASKPPSKTRISRAKEKKREMERKNAEPTSIPGVDVPAINITSSDDEKDSHVSNESIEPPVAVDVISDAIPDKDEAKSSKRKDKSSKGNKKPSKSREVPPKATAVPSKRKASSDKAEQTIDTEGSTTAKRPKIVGGTDADENNPEIVSSDIQPAIIADSVDVVTGTARDSDAVPSGRKVRETMVLSPGGCCRIFCTHDKVDTLYIIYDKGIRFECLKDYLANGMLYYVYNATQQDRQLTIEQRDVPVDTSSTSTAATTNQ